MSGHTKTRVCAPQFIPIQLRSGYYARNVGPLTLSDARDVCRLAQAAPALVAALRMITAMYGDDLTDKKFRDAANHYAKQALSLAEPPS